MAWHCYVHTKLISLLGVTYHLLLIHAHSHYNTLGLLFSSVSFLLNCRFSSSSHRVYIITGICLFSISYCCHLDMFVVLLTGALYAGPCTPWDANEDLPQHGAAPERHGKVFWRRCLWQFLVQCPVLSPSTCFHHHRQYWWDSCLTGTGSTGYRCPGKLACSTKILCAYFKYLHVYLQSLNIIQLRLYTHVLGLHYKQKIWRPKAVLLLRVSHICSSGNCTWAACFFACCKLCSAIWYRHHCGLFLCALSLWSLLISLSFSLLFVLLVCTYWCRWLYCTSVLGCKGLGSFFCLLSTRRCVLLVYC